MMAQVGLATIRGSSSQVEGAERKLEALERFMERLITGPCGEGQKPPDLFTYRVSRFGKEVFSEGEQDRYQRIVPFAG